MQAFAAVAYEYWLEHGQMVSEAVDDLDVIIPTDVLCRVCCCRVQNIREYKAAHVVWHQRLEPSAGIE
ncbi:hypothetical protein NY057_05320 [Curtobacterium flaccumfaciens]|uniref:hypothetical protein n=1 Tax=Curtobacterium flaccumfaciens TaxID=2035 RepID=UPI00220F1439|nr:hypothetical protein [Curtobacterium flaccumfaciens]UWD83666.1 hypothetical protein NY057_05320 [Curtobacterium flaccumfaciens]